jgi:RraA family protein
VRRSFERVGRPIVERYREFETPDISDMLNRLYTMRHQIKNLINDERILGPALTVKVYPGDNLMVHKALDFIQPGDVVVVDAGGHSANAVIGDLVATKAKHRRCAGFIIDGLIRDLPAMREIGLPVYAAGVSPIGPLHRGPGELNYAVSCGGIVVNPGDLIVADETGVVVVRRDFAEQVLGRLQAQRERLNEYIADVKRGIFSNEWVDRQLEQDGCVFD